MPPTLASGEHLGQALRAVREYKGLALEDVAEATRVRRAYLDAVENMRIEALPSRPFTIGYIRAYAAELGLDPETAVARFRREQPDPDTALHAPVGVQSGPDPRLGLIGVAGAVIVAAIFGWNVIQRAMSDEKPEPAPVAKAPAVSTPAARAKDAAVALGAPLPPPVESTTPPLYETPGLKEAALAEAAAASGAPAPVAAPAPAGHEPPPNLAPTFQAKGKVYGGAAGESSGVVLQALRPAAIMVRSADGTVHFARYLAAGESYRVPATAGLTVDVPETNAFQVFAAGESKGVLPTGVTATAKLAAAMPKPVAVAAPAARPAAAAPAAVAAAAPAAAAVTPRTAAPAAQSAPAPQAAPQH